MTAPGEADSRIAEIRERDAAKGGTRPGSTWTGTLADADRRYLLAEIDVLLAELDRVRAGRDALESRIAAAIELLPATQDLTFIGRDQAARQMRDDAAGLARGFDRCRHCGTWGPPGEDHTCPCPHRDDDCPVHTDRFAYADAAIAALRDPVSSAGQPEGAQ